jgi:hypothetical protein
MLKAHFWRIHSLEIHLIDEELRAFVSEWKANLYQLKVLRLRNASRHGRALRDEEVVTLRHIHGADKLLITELVLDHVHVPWQVVRFRHLRVLEIVGQLPQFAPSINEFLRALQASPGLESLRMINAGPFAPSDHTGILPMSQETVNMPQLYSLVIDNSRSENIAHLLKHLSLPVLRKLNLSSEIQNKNEDFESFFPPDVNIGKDFFSSK